VNGDVRVIWRLYSAAGVSPTIAVDTQDRSPPLFEDTGPPRILPVVLQPADTDIQLVLPTASCNFLLVSDEPIVLKLKTGETALRTRVFLVCAEDETGTALPAQTLLLSGNGSTVATVEVFAQPKV